MASSPRDSHRSAVARNAKVLALLNQLLRQPTVSIKRVAQRLACTHLTTNGSPMSALARPNRDAVFRVAYPVPTHVLRPHPAGHPFGAAELTLAAGNLLIQRDLRHAFPRCPKTMRVFGDAKKVVKEMVKAVE